jgi:hypothetical protein
MGKKKEKSLPTEWEVTFLFISSVTVNVYSTAISGSTVTLIKYLQLIMETVLLKKQGSMEFIPMYL